MYKEKLWIQLLSRHDELIPERIAIVATRPSHCHFGTSRLSPLRLSSPPMHFDTHTTVIADLEARIATIRDSL
jgi:hypothetical protein